MTYSNKLRAAVDILTDEGYELTETVYYRLNDIEQQFISKGNFFTAENLAKRYNELYHKDKSSAVFYCRKTKEELERLRQEEEERKSQERKERLRQRRENKRHLKSLQ